MNTELSKSHQKWPGIPGQIKHLALESIQRERLETLVELEVLNRISEVPDGS